MSHKEKESPKFQTKNFELCDFLKFKSISLSALILWACTILNNSFNVVLYSCQSPAKNIFKIQLQISSFSISTTHRRNFLQDYWLYWYLYLSQVTQVTIFPIFLSIAGSASKL
ncbi:Hypothetical_protein [Hexamita inflata]|uniref:Hypothetical_protein n=1 Tax=Hexamita inflata TaxID=28002 RepID=A0ABP1KD15_9EUKA